MKKMTATVMGFLLSASLLLPNQSFADSQNQPFVIEGKEVQGRTLIPVRQASAGLGAQVNWNQQAKTVSIVKEDTKILLKIDSNKAVVNGKTITIDVPAQVDKGLTYVPIRFISQSLGGTIAWNASDRYVDVTVGDKQVRVVTELTYNHSMMPQALVNLLIKKANEATDLSSYSQIREHFKPYFTDAFINKLIQQKGLVRKEIYSAIPYSYSDDQTGWISQTSADYSYERKIIITYSQGKWMVDNIFFTLLNP